jgi:hypothetical protein
MLKKLILILVFGFLLIGCGVPDKQKISKNFEEFFNKEVGTSLSAKIVSRGSGEGDSENVYEHVTFDVVAEKDVSLKEGWLTGLSLKQGQMLKGGEAVILYQKINGTGWKMTRYSLKRLPQ